MQDNLRVTAEALPFRPEALLEHRDFVRALARSLVRDEHAAQDVAQETWLAALRHPPASVTSLRAWLARITRHQASNARRSDTRRSARELTSAREELDDSDERVRERVALQHEVVAAVLVLREPYRTVVLLHYYEGSSAADIARRRNVPAGTVRAQLSRALEQLRERLDREHGGDRAAWSAALLTVSRSRSAFTKVASASALAKLLAGAAAIGAAWLGAHGLNQRTVRTTSEELVAAAAPTISAEPPASPAIVAPPVESSEADRREPADSSQVGTTAAAGVGLQDLDSRSISELAEISTQIQALLRERLLTPPERFRSEQAALLRLPDTGLARILPRERFGGDNSGVVGLRQGGSYWSFQTRSNDYDAEPDLSVEQGRYRSGFYGNATGVILPLGSRSLLELSSSDPSPPADLTPQEADAWRLLWTDAKTTDREFDPVFEQELRKLRPQRTEARVGQTYLLRSISAGEHDLLVAFTCLDQDAYGQTLAWRILRRWKIRGSVTRRPAKADPVAAHGDLDPALVALSTDDLLATFRRIQAIGQEKLLAIPEELRRAHPEEQIARILDGDSFERLVAKRGGGRFFSFVTLNNELGAESDLELSQGKFRGGFSGSDEGFVLDLGELPPGQVSTVAPSSLGEREREAWDFLWNVQFSETMPRDSKPTRLSASDRQRAATLRLTSGTAANVGDTYLLRSMLAGHHDVVVAFTVIAIDDYGCFLSWRILRISRESQPANEGRPGADGRPGPGKSGR